MGTYITFPELFILLPLFGGIIAFFVSSGQAAKRMSLFVSVLVWAIFVVALFYTDRTKYISYNNVNYLWLKYLGSNYYIGLDAMGRMLVGLTATAFPLIFIATANNNVSHPKSFYGLMLLSQAGLMGVFCAFDALTFYFFWELALIPVYFLCSKWGGEKRIQATFKFFVYTFVGSLLMLIGIIYVYLHTEPRTIQGGITAVHSFTVGSFYNVALTAIEQKWLFVLFFVAFAIKMPIFPFHTWQPDAYDQSPTPVTMVMSGIMVKMGLFGVVRWLIPVLPLATKQFASIVIILSIIGIIYASCLAMVQDNIKRLVAYSSIAHIGLMCAAIFALNPTSVQGAMIQMFTHGINIIGLWIVVELIERQTGIKHISALGGLAQKAPSLTILLVIVAFANIALPLTNAFPGEFMMLSGLYEVKTWYAIAAGLGVILSAVYTLNMIQKVFYGHTNDLTQTVKDIAWNEKLALLIIIAFVFVLGVYPQPLIELTKESVTYLLTRFA